MFDIWTIVYYVLLRTPTRKKRSSVLFKRQYLVQQNKKFPVNESSYLNN